MESLDFTGKPRMNAADRPRAVYSVAHGMPVPDARRRNVRHDRCRHAQRVR
ncbi:hypothetical protein BURMUCF1_A2027 [Burkholderia multivorans ATCC BAA-247]|nr:hypothetical protein BURMUCGD2M_3531 [Burkholderia multivorans CGD2M]EJO52346.1 hypothetical protein BURMUCF1_A2027 [Burkholderia multivorans ATCC BAA-247]